MLNNDPHRLSAISRLELRHLRYFSVAAELEHFGKAAAELRVSSAAISRQVQELESILGVQLFERVSRGVRLSDAGRIFLNDVNEILGKLESTVSRLSRYSGREIHLNIGLNDTSITDNLIVNCVRDFEKSNPQVKLNVYPVSSVESLNKLRTGDLDAAFVFRWLGPNDDLEYLPAASHELVLAIHHLNPLTQADSIKLADLQNQKFVFLSRGYSSVFYDELISHCLRGGLRPHIIQEVSKEPSIIRFVSADLAIAFVPSSARWRIPSSVVLREIVDLSMKLPLDLVWRAEDASPTLIHFIRQVRSTTGNRLSHQ